MFDYSVLMSVYHKVDAEVFDLALKSMFEQTHPTNDFVLVCDGPLTPELDRVIDDYSERFGSVLNVIRLPENVGIGEAANIGLKECKNDLVAKMDADDISVSERCALQCKRFEENPELVVIGGYIEEFDEDPEKPFSVRAVPKDNEDIRHFARRRQPFNNQTVMYKKKCVMQIGGYRPLRRNEDYDLYVRLLNEGFYSENLALTLVKVRVDEHARARRASMATFKGCVQSRWSAYKIGYSSIIDFIVCCLGEAFICICPGKVQQFLYQRLFRKKTD